MHRKNYKYLLFSMHKRLEVFIFKRNNLFFTVQFDAVQILSSQHAATKSVHLAKDEKAT